MKTVLETINLTKIYGKNDHKFKALDDVNLKISQGESVAIVGKSGSGKSTLMHLLALLDTPSLGNINVLGKNASSLDKKEINSLRNLTYGFVFQQFFLNANDTVLNNVILPLKIAGVGKSERNRRGLSVLQSVELADKASSKASDLSGGQKQRVVIARALINNPKVIFADEPTGNLDSKTSEVIENILFDLNKTKNITLVIVTHDADLAKKCSRVLTLRDGKISKGKKK